VEVSSANQQLDLRRREAEIAVRMARPTQPDLTFRLAFRLGWAVYASEAYLVRRGTPATPADLGAHDLLLYSAALAGIAGPHWLEEHQGGGRVVMRADSAQVAAHAAASGVGVTVLPCFLEEELRELRRVFPAPVGFAEGYLVIHEDLRGSTRVKIVVDALAAFFEKHRGLMSGVAA
jgi:DNA-binding transcriptional LysR family regulator